VYHARSAGTSDSARIKITQPLIDWADIIFVMEQRHKQILVERFVMDKQVDVLDIPNEYRYLDPELIEMIKTSVSQYLE